jgi:hypothetical protein
MEQLQFIMLVVVEKQEFLVDRVVVVDLLLLVKLIRAVAEELVEQHLVVIDFKAVQEL